MNFPGTTPTAGTDPSISISRSSGAHSITVNTAGNTYGAIFGSASGTFSGGVIVNNGGVIQVESGVSSVVSGGALVSGPLGTGTITLNAGATLGEWPWTGGPAPSIANDIQVNGNATIQTGNALSLAASALSSPATFGLAGRPTLNVQGNLRITNYLFQGTGFTLGSGNPYVSSPGLSQTGITTSVTLGPGTGLTYNVGTLSTAGSFEFGQQAITLNGGTFQFNAASARRR